MSGYRLALEHTEGVASWHFGVRRWRLVGFVGFWVLLGLLVVVEGKE